MFLRNVGRLSTDSMALHPTILNRRLTQSLPRGVGLLATGTQIAVDIPIFRHTVLSVTSQSLVLQEGAVTAPTK
jgi:hypothetical protein